MSDLLRSAVSEFLEEYHPGWAAQSASINAYSFKIVHKSANNRLKDGSYFGIYFLTKPNRYCTVAGQFRSPEYTFDYATVLELISEIIHASEL